ncbi:MAG: hypothetical protein HOO96_26075 [Polyangiaceae bacterium]|nr:hypothetical protein [Polyangiaceae bacterium]
MSAALRNLDVDPKRHLGASVVGDSRGSVMFSGVFMALFLVGALWFLIGIGDAIVYRQTAQEASDSAVFSAAALHAKGMNIISFLNCLMLAIVFIYLLLAVVVDVILFVTGLAMPGIVTIWAVPELVSAAKQVDNVAKTYKQGMATALPTFAAVQTAVAYLAPWGGSLAAGSVSKRYGFFTIAVGPSNIPGSDASVRKLLGKVSGGAVDKVLPRDSGRLAAFDAATKKLGLPVRTRKMNFLCEVAVGFVMDKLFQLVKNVPLAGWFFGQIRQFLSGILSTSISEVHCREAGSNTTLDSKDLYDKKPPGGFFSQAIKRLIAAATSAVGSLAGYTFSVYQAEKWWNDDYGGPKALYSTGVRNGSEWNQIWGWTPTNYGDAQDGKVRVATYHAGSFKGATKSSGLVGNHYLYTAQSEFYYDCKDAWDTAACNGDDAALYDYTMYSMRWRARIVRYRGFGLTTFASLFGDFVGEFLTTNEMSNWYKDKLGISKAGELLPKGPIRDILVNRGRNNQEDLFTKGVKKIVNAGKGAVKPPRAGTQALH